MPDDPFFSSSLGRWVERNRHRRDRSPQRALAKVLGVALAVARDVAQGPMTLHASSLVYTTLLSIVPLMALAFSILKGFGVHNQIAPMLKELLAPLGKEAAEITNNVVTFVDNMHVGVLGASGLIILLYTSISVGRKVEQAFNEIWHVSATQSLGHSVTKYLSIIVAGPILLFSAFATTASVMGSALAQDLTTYEPVARMIELVSLIFPYVIVLAGFTLFYRIVPNTRVRITAALTGGIAASCAWTLAGWAFSTFVASSGSYTAIYSAFASVILLLIWLNVNWLVLLVGCAVAFYVQHPQSLRHGHLPRDDTWSREHAALAILRVIGGRYYDAETTDAVTLREQTGLPQEAVDATLQRLENAHLLLPTAGEPPAWVPGRPFDATSVGDAWVALRSGNRDDLDLASADPVVTEYQDRIDQGVRNALGDATLKELALAPKPQGRSGAGANGRDGMNAEG
jgi:Predicted membrane protein